MARYEKVVVDTNSADAANYIRSEEGGEPLSCIVCKNVLYWDDAFDYGRGYGHVFSDLGISEVRISGCCEYCFDKLFPDVEDYYG